MDAPLNWNSRNLTRGWQRGITAFYYGLGWTEEDFDKPQIGIGVPLLDGNLCNLHAYDLARQITDGCRNAGLIGLPFGVPAISDNITQGHEGGNASLPSRNLIANAAECVVSAHGYDALVGMHHCDKNGPGFAMALARLNYPGLLISGGTIMPGVHHGQEISILDVYDAQAAVAVGEMDAAEADEIFRTACPGVGGCGIAASFNTWGVAMEAIGLMLPGSSAIPAVDQAKHDECHRLGRHVREMLQSGLRPRDLLTRRAFENAATAMAAIGGSTNGVLHLLALAREAQVVFTLRDMQSIFARTPVLCGFAPRGRKTMVDLHRIGGTPVLLKHLWRAGLLDGAQGTVVGQTLGQVLQQAADLPEGQQLVAPKEAPLKPFADMQICFGNLAPDGIVFKVSSMQEPRFRGTAMCFDDARAVADAVEHGQIRPGSVIVLRYLGPVAAGMPEVLVASAALAVPELDGRVALISDTRVSGVSHGAIGVHCAPEAALGGPIALVADGDEISFDLLAGEIILHITDEELGRRRQQWRPAARRFRRGYLLDFAATVTQANHGCVSRALYPDCA
ncbi:MAG: dihydroxy-acid dehydratase [Planctomycetaceae bacterium]|nr:MAG: dihydroxy-acid dehydratase [Planctomycetaceae bacterium]